MRFGNQVGDSPRFNLSISSTLSAVPDLGNLKLDARPAVANGLSSSGLSGTGPSHKSVLMLSSETFLSITFRPSGDFDGRVTVVLSGVLLRRLPKSS